MAVNIIISETQPETPVPPGSPGGYTVDSVSALAALTPAVGDIAFTLGYTTAHDGGGNTWAYDADSTATLSDTVVNGPSGVGRWLLIKQDAHYVPSLTPVQTSIANVTEAADAATNATAINARLTAWADQAVWQPLDLKAHGYIIDSSLVIPRRTGGSIRCDGGFTGTTRGESEYSDSASSGLGGMGTRLLRDTGMTTTDPMIDYSGGGLEVQGSLMLQGIYHATRTPNLTTTPNGSNKTGIGILVRGVGGTGGLSTGMNTGKIHANSLTFSNLETGIQLGTYLDQNAADNLRIENLQFDYCQRGFYFVNKQAINIHLGTIRPYITPLIFDLDYGANMSIDMIDLGSDAVDTTVFRDRKSVV